MDYNCYYDDVIIFNRLDEDLTKEEKNEIIKFVFEETEKSNEGAINSELIELDAIKDNEMPDAFEASSINVMSGDKENSVKFVVRLKHVRFNKYDRKDIKTIYSKLHNNKLNFDSYAIELKK